MDRHTLRKQLMLLLGDGIVDVELEQDHLDLAIDMAFAKAKQRTDGSQSETYLLQTLQPDVEEYTLPDEVQEVVKIHRRVVGSGPAAAGVNFDPFQASFSNLYLLQNGLTGGIATWDFFSMYQETLGKVFSSDLDYKWNPVTKKLYILRKIIHQEDVAILVTTERTEAELLKDPYVGPWLRDYSLARIKLMLGEARSKYSGGLPGPSGNVTLNGAELKAEGNAEVEKLEKELTNFVASRTGHPFIIG